MLHNNFSVAHRETERVLKTVELSQYRNMRSSKLPIEKRKWLDLARILVTRPKLIMLDEVMAGLNGSEMDDSIKLVKRINQEEGITVVVIEHIMKAILTICNRVIVLNEGQVFAEGAPKEVLSRPEVIHAYIGGDLSDA